MVITLAAILIEIFFWKKRTGGHGVALAEPRNNDKCRLDIRKFSFLQITVTEWSILSADGVGASSVNRIKSKIYI